MKRKRKHILEKGIEVWYGEGIQRTFCKVFNMRNALKKCKELAEWGYTMIVVDVIYRTHDGELYEDKSEWYQFKDNKLIRI